MILTLGQYIEALTNPEGRFRTLGRVCPVADSAGELLFSIPGHSLADFEIIADGARMTLRCPLRAGAAAEVGLRSLAEKDRGLGSRFFTEWELREKEIVLFGESGRPVEPDVLVRPATEGMPAERFLQQAAGGGAASIMSALAGLAELADWLQEVRREVSVRRLYFAADGSAHVTGFSAAGELGDAALALFFTAAMPGKIAEAGLPLLTKAAAAKPLASRLCAEAAASGFPEPQQILAGDIAGPLHRLACCPPERIAELGKHLESLVASTDPETGAQTQGYEWEADESGGIRCVKDVGGWRYEGVDGSAVAERVWLSAAPFREGRAEVEAREGKGLIDKEGRCILEPVYEEVAWDDYWGLASVMLEGRWSLLDREGKLLTDAYYDWLGECSEGFVLAQKGGRCGFLDTEGREAIPFLYDDATSFSEGVSFVTRGEESFFIDGKGVRVAHEKFDDVKSPEKGR